MLLGGEGAALDDGADATLAASATADNAAVEEGSGQFTTEEAGQALHPHVSFLVQVGLSKLPKALFKRSARPPNRFASQLSVPQHIVNSVVHRAE